MKLCKTYEKLTMTSQVSYENVKFTATDVIRETLCQRLLLVEYFELKITDNQSDDFLRMLSKNDLPFSYENLRKSYIADSQKTYENLTMNLGKNLTKFQKSGPRAVATNFSGKTKHTNCRSNRVLYFLVVACNACMYTHKGVDGQGLD